MCIDSFEKNEKTEEIFIDVTGEMKTMLTDR